MDLLLIALSLGGLTWVGFQTIHLGSGDALQRFQAASRRRQETRNLKDQVESEVQHSFLRYRRASRPPSLWRSLAVADIVQQSSDAKTFLLIDPAGDKLPSFLPGQHLLVESSGPGSQLRRCYSLSLGPGKGFYQITVKRKADGHRDHSLSVRLHDEVRIGQILKVKGPQGNFFLDPLAKTPVVLLAAGIGITPMLSMLEGILDQSPTTSVWLFYQVRNSKQEAFGQRLRELSKKYSQFRLFIYHSQPDREGMHLGKVQAGKLTMGDVQAELGSVLPQFYMCGPDAWMHACVDQLQQIGYPQDHIHYESFGSEAPVAAPKSPSDTSQTGYEVRFTQTQTQVRCSEQESLLDAALTAKANVESGCRSGNCGSCVAKLLKGKIAYRNQPHCDVDDEHIALCMAEPRSAVEIEA